MEQKVQGKETGGEGRGTDASPAKEISLRYENKRQVAEGGILGFFIGLAVIVPGVSGSAVAIVFKLYEKLLYALGSFFRKFKTSLLFLLPIGMASCGCLFPFRRIILLSTGCMSAGLRICCRAC